MAKRDIKVNYDDLGDTLSQIGTYRSALETMRTAVKETNDLICASNDAETIEKLEKRYKKAKKRMDDCYEELDALYGLIDGYITDMTAIIEPKKGLTRVGRNDIYWNPPKRSCRSIMTMRLRIMKIWMTPIRERRRKSVKSIPVFGKS